MYYLIYFSQATHIMSEGDLNLLLIESRAWNETHGITGMLAYIEGWFGTNAGARFMQVLEGTQQEVERIFDKIKKDSRHHDLVLLQKEAIKERNFNDWHMKFEQVDLASHPELITFFQLDGEILQSDDFKSSNIALKFLMSF